MEDSSRSTSQTLAFLNFLFGIWLIISPYVLHYAVAQAKWQQTIAGIIIAALAISRYTMPHIHWSSWINTILGAWMIIAPFATGYTRASAYWNEVIFGALVLIASLWNVNLSPINRHHGQHHHAM